MGATLFYDIENIVSMSAALGKKGRKIVEKDLSLIKEGCLVVEKGKIKWIGTKKKLPSEYLKYKKKSLKGYNVFPGFIDCHTHLIFSGDRKNEFELRNQGMSYQQIASQGGGIISTVHATRKASLSELIRLGQGSVEFCLSQGVTTIEVKSGYGLNSRTEEKMLRAAQGLKNINVVTTFLGAHALPKEYKNEKEYLDQLKKDLLQIKKKGLSQRVDIFVEKNYFSIQGAKDYLIFAQSLGFAVTIHADQLSRTKAALLAVELKALSADHVICLNQEDKRVLAKSETTAVLLPSADFYLQCDYPDARQLMDLGGRVALASDFNPGSSPTQNIQFVGLLARLKMHMTLPEVFSALTVGGAYALSLEDKKGALIPGSDADFFVTTQRWDEFFYDLKPLKIEATYVLGKKVY